MIELFERDTCRDLILRGFSQDFILAVTSVDVGYHGNGFKTELRGIDRMAYKVEHVRCRVSRADVLHSLVAYAKGTPKTDVLLMLGLSGENIVKLHVLFDALGLHDAFAKASKVNRKANMRRGMIDKFGTDNAFKLPEFQQIAADTRTRLYGAPYTLCHGSVLSGQARNTAAIHMMDPVFKHNVVKKREATNLRLYGVAYAAQSDEFLDRMLATFEANHGPIRISYPVQRLRRALSIPPNFVWFNGRFVSRSEWAALTYADRSIKARQTCLDKYGVLWISQTDVWKEQMHRFMIEHRDENLEKSQKTCFNRYGVPYFVQTAEFRAKQSLRMSNHEYQRKLIQSRADKGSWCMSEPEERLYDMLVQYFGECDVIRQYRESRYNFFCDFYVVSRDLFIELNGTWLHGGHWFDRDSLNDIATLERWRNKKNKYYDCAVRTWTARDVLKRMTAAINELNYAVFWQSDLSDAVSWFEAGCPDRTDWEGE